MSSLWFPGSLTHSHTPSGFSSLFKMLDDFERYSGKQGGQLSAPGESGSILGSSGTSAMIAPKFDVSEDEKAYRLQGELPGVPPENVVIEFTDPQTLVVRGKVERTHIEGDPAMATKGIGGGGEQGKIEEKKGDQKSDQKSDQKGDQKGQGDKKETETKGGSKSRYWLTERSFGEFSRVFSFPSSVDQDKVEAKFEHGVLNITVPKVEKKGARRIEIK